MTPSMLDRSRPHDAHVLDRLEKDVIAWLGTVRADGRPHMVAVWFLWEPDTGTVLVFSKPGQQKVRNIESNPNVVLALDNTDNGEDVIVLDGKAALLNGGEVSTAMPAYAEKYGELMKGIGFNPQTMAPVYNQATRITVTKVYEL